MARTARRSRSRERRLAGKPPTDPRYEVVFENHAANGAISGVLGKLRPLASRIGNAVVTGYALATKLVLEGVERLEDASAERRFRRHGRLARAKSAAPAGTAKPVPSKDGEPSPS